MKLIHTCGFVKSDEGTIVSPDSVEHTSRFRNLNCKIRIFWKSSQFGSQLKFGSNIFSTTPNAKLEHILGYSETRIAKFALFRPVLAKFKI